MGAAMAENCPFSVDSELEVSKLNSGLVSLGTSRTPLMTSSLDILKKSLVIKENKQRHQTHSLSLLTNTVPRQSGGLLVQLNSPLLKIKSGYGDCGPAFIV